ncbi:hypothetical protein [Actinoplanes sp. L3-i22]|uniref:hypothetical protein n=1 Tax=Actinoplanes sp. L3-i22 TaxID=2836373 RepID=UPI001C774335|nr:hypothetical protein [Actinoplanes sp. L3-i22]BCY08730.1 hypothetical protein L3i22_038180 [Actinoplanes sp. L3-i22]
MGTDAWRNWRAFDEAGYSPEEYDDELHSDVPFYGGKVTFGPYSLATIIRASELVGPAVIVHGSTHTNLIPEVIVDGKLAKSDSSAYHGGTIADEIAALVSLELGVRLRFAGTLRVSGIYKHGEPKEPPLYFEVPRLASPGRPNRELVPMSKVRRADLGQLYRLGSFPRIEEVAQAELVRAARSYSSALWWANEDPNQSWLQLVTAAETAATCRQLLTAESTDLLQEIWPEMWSAIQSADSEGRADVAELLAEQMKATRKFIDFLTDCAPDEPEHRPQFDRLDWTKIRKHASTIYRYRSKALHEGKPFPLPMLEAPRIDPNGAPQEVPSGLNSGGQGGVWKASETPMLLSTFEYIVRGALLRWWDELAATGQSGPADTE